MPAQRGKDMLLRVDETGSAQFVTVGGMRSRKLTFNAQSIDVTDSESTGRWRELMGGAGTRTTSLTGQGIFKDSSSDALIKDLFFNDTVRNWQIVIPDFGQIEGPFQMASLEYGGEYDGGVSFDITLQSAGALSFTAV